jgi:Secretion system C-terminal sorting domain
MKQFYIIITFVTLVSIGFSQTTEPTVTIERPINLTFEEAVNQRFGAFDDSKIPSGILKDRSIQILNWDNYSGMRPVLLTRDSLLELYSELYYSYIYKDNLKNVFEIDSLATLFIKETGTIPIMVINLTYHKIKQEAWDNGWIVDDGYEFIDLTPNGQTPFEEKTIFAVAPLADKFFNVAQDFIITSDMYISNKPLPDKIRADFGDGMGYRDITTDKTVSGVSNLRNTASFQSISNEDTLVSKFIIHDQSSGIAKSGYAPLPDATFNLIVGGLTHQYGVWYSCESNGCIRKPLIVVEGFDPTNKRNLTNLSSLNCSGVGDVNDLNLYDLLNAEGGMADKFINSGYDIIILNYADGKRSIQDKAAVVKALIEELKIKVDACGSNEEFVIMGPSEGGLVARYALAEMEGNNQDHNTRLFISVDAPQQGANLPLSLQYFIKFVFDLYPQLWFSPAGELINVLNATPTKQMLNYHYTIEGYIDHINFYSELQTLNGGIGYPVECRNISVSNGSGSSLGQGFNANAKLFGFNFISGLFNYVMDGWALPDGNQETIFSGIAFLGFFPYYSEIIQIDNTKPYDNAPGGYINFISSTRDQLEDALGFLFAGSVNQAFQSFIPTTSALDLQNTTDLFYNVHTNLTNNQNKAYNLGSSITPFDAIYVGSANDNHVICGSTNDINDFIIDEMALKYLYLQNKTINDATDFEALKTISAGNNVTNTIAPGDFIIQNSSGSIKIRSGEEITLTTGTEIKPTITGSAELYIQPFTNCEPFLMVIDDTDEVNVNSKNLNYSKNIDFVKENNDFENILKESKLKIYPNPNDGKFTIDLGQENKNSKLFIYNLIGEKIAEYNNVNNKLEIDISQLSKGVYTVKSFDVNGVRTSIIISK